MEFDPAKHEADLAEKYRRLAKYDAFDKLIDMALDPNSPVTQEEAIAEFRKDYADAEA